MFLDENKAKSFLTEEEFGQKEIVATSKGNKIRLTVAEHKRYLRLKRKEMTILSPKIKLPNKKYSFRKKEAIRFSQLRNEQHKSSYMKKDVAFGKIFQKDYTPFLFSKDKRSISNAKTITFCIIILIFLSFL